MCKKKLLNNYNVLFILTKIHYVKVNNHNSKAFALSYQFLEVPFQNNILKYHSEDS